MSETGFAATPGMDSSFDDGISGLSSPSDAAPNPGGGGGPGGTPAGGGVGAPGWDSSIGKAGLGKTGRVINKLVSDNEALKRDLQIERLKADEARQAARLLEDKMERVVGDYESRLLEATVTKTLLARKERQVESLTALVETERRRAREAVERERGCIDEMERLRVESRRAVGEASTHAALVEGRYNALAGHWREKGEEVEAKVAEARKEVRELAAERRADDERIAVLGDLCDQQDGNIRDLVRQKEELAQRFEEYKREQERLLADIKAGAAERERKQEETLREATEVLHKLKWALNVKQTVQGSG